MAYSHTKKVGSLGRYGPRVGRKLRHEVRKIEDQLHTAKACPQCGKPKVTRKAAGIWSCRSCSSVFTGGAYNLHTSRKAMQAAFSLSKLPAKSSSDDKPVIEKVEEIIE